MDDIDESEGQSKGEDAPEAETAAEAIELSAAESAQTEEVIQITEDAEPTAGAAAAVDVTEVPHQLERQGELETEGDLPQDQSLRTASVSVDEQTGETSESVSLSSSEKRKRKKKKKKKKAEEHEGKGELERGELVELVRRSEEKDPRATCKETSDVITDKTSHAIADKTSHAPNDDMTFTTVSDEQASGLPSYSSSHVVTTSSAEAAVAVETADEVAELPQDDVTQDGDHKKKRKKKKKGKKSRDLKDTQQGEEEAAHSVPPDTVQPSQAALVRDQPHKDDERLIRHGEFHIESPTSEDPLASDPVPTSADVDDLSPEDYHSLAQGQEKTDPVSESLPQWAQDIDASIEKLEKSLSSAYVHAPAEDIEPMAGPSALRTQKFAAFGKEERDSEFWADEPQSESLDEPISQPLDEAMYQPLKEPMSQPSDEEASQPLDDVPMDTTFLTPTTPIWLEVSEGADQSDSSWQPQAPERKTKKKKKKKTKKQSGEPSDLDPNQAEDTEGLDPAFSPPAIQLTVTPEPSYFDLGHEYSHDLEHRPDLDLSSLDWAATEVPAQAEGGASLSTERGRKEEKTAPSGATASLLAPPSSSGARSKSRSSSRRRRRSRRREQDDEDDGRRSSTSR
jgi:hypothetical protein